MSTSIFKNLLFISGFTFIILIIGINQLMAWFIPSHFIPTQKMEAALSQGDSCILFLGDSRMAAGLDLDSFKKTLQEKGHPACAIDLSLGGVGLSGQTAILREYLKKRKAPKAVVLGFCGDSLIKTNEPQNLHGFNGSEAVSLLWSKTSDVFLHYPGFPWNYLDPGIRFLISRLTSFQTYSSVIWFKVQSYQNKWILNLKSENKNRFGAVADMFNLEEKMLSQAKEKIGNPSERIENPWFTELKNELLEHKIPLILAELPMPSRYRKEVSQTESAFQYRYWLKAKTSGTLINLSQPQWISDDLLEDKLHLSSKGAKLLSQDMAKEILPFLIQINLL